LMNKLLQGAHHHGAPPHNSLARLNLNISDQFISLDH